MRLARHPLAIAGALIATWRRCCSSSCRRGARRPVRQSVRRAGRVRRACRPRRARAAADSRSACGSTAQAATSSRRRSRVARHRFPTRRVRRVRDAHHRADRRQSRCRAAAGYGALHWMESPTFCGQVCHTPMQPQFTAWSAGPHARVAVRRLSHRRGRRRFRSRQARRRAAARARRDRLDPPGAPAGRDDAARRAGADLRPVPLSPSVRVGDRIRVFASTPTTKRTPRRRPCSRCTWSGASPSRGAAFTGTPIPPTRSSTSPTTRTRQTIPYVRVTDRQRPREASMSRRRRHRAIPAGCRRDGWIAQTVTTRAAHPDIADAPERRSTRPLPTDRVGAVDCRSCAGKAVRRCVEPTGDADDAAIGDGRTVLARPSTRRATGCGAIDRARTRPHRRRRAGAYRRHVFPS